MKVNVKKEVESVLDRIYLDGIGRKGQLPAIYGILIDSLKSLQNKNTHTLANKLSTTRPYWEVQKKTLRLSVARYKISNWWSNNQTMTIFLWLFKLGSIADNHLIEKDTAVLNAESNLKAVDTEFLG